MVFRFFVCLIIFNFFSIQAFSQIGIGQWRDHLPFAKFIAVSNNNSVVYSATPYSLLIIDQGDNSITRLNKVNGLSDNRIQDIDFSSSANALIIAYSNTNVDIHKSEAIINLSDIKRKPILGNKTINQIHIQDHLAYLACGFGIVVIDLQREEVKDTYLIGPGASHINVQDVCINDTAIFAASDEGLFYANLNSANLADYSNWNRITTIPTSEHNFSHIASIGNNLILVNKRNGYNTDQMYYTNGSGWTAFDPDQRSDIQSMQVDDDQLLITRNMDILVFNDQLIQTQKIWSPEQKSIFPLDAYTDNSGNIWVADQFLGLIKTSNDGFDGEFILPEGPFSPNVYAMTALEDQLWAVSGGRTEFWSPQFSRDGFYRFKDEQWTSFNCISDDCAFPQLEEIRDMICVAINPNDENNVFVGTWEKGLLELEGDEISANYTDQNSSLQVWTADPGRILVSDLAFDINGNLWIANSGAEDILSVKDQDDQWMSFNLGTINTSIDISDLLIDDAGNKWIIPRRSRSLIAFSDQGTPMDKSDDSQKNLSSSVGNGALFANKIHCFAKDHDGELWVGTDEGIGVIYTPENVFTSGSYDMQRIIVEWDGYSQYLLETEVITSIAVDGANRKWIGTQNSGIFVLTEDGETQVHHFTTDNSPLFSNTITDIAILSSGEVFIGTTEGLISYRAEAASPGNGIKEIYAYPNPVPVGYSGTIAIKNLVRDANVKITDISGNVVFETYALGGQAVWDGRNFSGEKASSGVYLVFASNEDGSVTLVTKILIIN
ncbi:MAG: hypothetical protein CL663_01010 [Bacteroidetes bacterium]|nr:hypothetical protein [Bacteroidota bacterium]